MRFREFMESSTYEMVDSIGIITAHNPMGRRLPYSKNRILNHHLLADIKILDCPTDNYQGTYLGHPEEAFVVVNISKADLIQLAERYKQQAVIWGQVLHDHEPSVKFEYIEDGHSIQEKEVDDIYYPDLMSKYNLFTAIKNGSFEIPKFEVH